MEEKNKEFYETPATRVVEVTLEGICSGSGETTDYHINSPLEW